MTIQFLEPYFYDLQGVTGLPADQNKFAICILLAIFLGLIQNIILRERYLRMIYQIFIGILVISIQFENIALFNLLVSSTVVYALLLLYPREKVATPVVIFSFAYLSAVYIYRMVVSYLVWQVDESSLQMILTLKLCSLGFNYQDAATILKGKDELIQERRRYFIKDLPNPVQYIGYLCFGATLLVGPTFEFADFKEYIDMNKSFENAPYPLLATLKSFSKAIILLVLHLVLSQYFPISLIKTPEFDNYDIVSKHAFLYISIIQHQMKYCSAFMLSQTAVISTGISFNGFDENGKAKQNRISCMNLKKFYLYQSVRDIIESWNQSVQTWLRRYVYIRIVYDYQNDKADMKKRDYGIYATFLVSAFWHGFYPGYWIFFILFPFSIDISKWWYNAGFSSTPLYFLINQIWRVLLMIIVGFNALSFCFLAFDDIWTAWKKFYFIPLFIMFGLWILFQVIGLHKSKRVIKTD